MTDKSGISLVKPGESGMTGDGRAMKRALHELLGSAEAMIPQGRLPSPDNIHDLRVNMKKGRAILKLLRSIPGTGWYRRENTALRDVSALFSSSREADVMLKTIKLLKKQNPAQFSGGREEWLKSAATVFLSNDVEAAMACAADARERLRRAWYRICFIDLSGVGERALLDGLLDSFLNAAGVFEKARISLDISDIHELRKRIKDLLYQVGFFSRYNPVHFSTLYKCLDKIASALGKCNDIAVLWKTVEPAAGKLPLREKSSLESAFGEVRVRLFREVENETEQVLANFYSSGG